MNKILQIIIILLCCTLTINMHTQAATPQAKPFTIVIDAGHGGRDPGAIGKITREKDINLAIALKLGKRIEQGIEDVKVHYTRTTDIFLPLQDRANYVNKQGADLFICIHTNAVDNPNVKGAETFTLGLNKAESNLDVAMRENSVILLEDDYKANYQGFDPNSVESYIMFDFMQDQYLDKSLSFAVLVQNNMTTKCARYDRGVRQAAFWVLHKSACPSVLVEVGFITNQQDEKYLASEEGRNALADAIYNAVVLYKKDIDKKNGIIKTQEQPNVTANTDNKEQKTTIANTICYKIQIAAVKEQLPANDPAFKGLKNIQYYKENNYYKYTYGEEITFEAINKLHKEIKNKFPDSFVVAFKDGQKINVKTARQLEQTK
ncbi:MAG: N-acetylmuramoyl-L-alanine amidase [Paludibacteraceae bacterium]|nr:N-acetylmuramoyl-L-alanine amidase [Paludibacteraceae bacterium]MBO7234276.1 N-acetylmuramoyl-L-alanine amidase [Paludibacteraceae bacterium]